MCSGVQPHGKGLQSKKLVSLKFSSWSRTCNGCLNLIFKGLSGNDPGVTDRARKCSVVLQKSF